MRHRTIQLFRTFTRPFITGLLLILALTLLNSVQITKADPLPPISFLAGQSLSGHSVQFPTAAQFGPDNRLYVLQKNGQIDIYEVTRSAPGNYAVASTEVINLVLAIPNHNDDGSVVDLGTERQATGFTVVGTADNPVIYVTSSDPRRGINGDADGMNIDTNSGIISRITWSGSYRDDPTGDWEKVDLVRGLPRSAEYHATNGVQYDAVNNRLFVASGGHTNMGAPDLSLSFVPEYALSAAVLEIDLTAIDALPIQGTGGANPYVYDIPTLTSGSDSNDPFGGQRGENQATIVEGGPVQIYSPGYRNPYDLVLTDAGRLYVTDNGPNSGFGRFLKTEADEINPNTSLPYGPGQCTNAPADASFPSGYTGRDQLHLVTDGFYGGHPAPIRGNESNQYNGQTPLSVSYDGTEECDFIWSGDSLNNIEDGALTTWGGSTNGIAEYTAGNFAGQMAGNLLTASYAGGGSVYRVQLSNDGQSVVANDVFFNMGGNPLDITAQGDFDIFPGTIWVVTPWPSDVIVFEPADYGGVDLGICDPSVPTEDSDSDTYINSDENLNGTSPCNAASYPRDNDGDAISDLADPDDDNDTINDEDDFFPIDADNGTTTDLPIFYDFDPGGANFGSGLAGGGFTGMMLDPGTGTEYLNLFDTDLMTVGGIAKVFVVDNVSAGTARGASNDQEYAFQKGINVDSSTGAFTFRTRIPSPYFDDDPQAGQEIGIYLGTGDQDNYLELAINAAGFVVIEEVAGTPATTQTNLNPFSSNYIDLFLTVDPAAGTVLPRYMLDDGNIVNLAPVTLQAGNLKTTLANSSEAVAIGFIATTGGADSFAAIWDSLEVEVDTPGVLVSDVTSHDFGLVGTSTVSEVTLTLENPGLSGDPNIDITDMQFTGSSDLAILSVPSYPVTLVPQETLQVTVEYTPATLGTLNATLDISYNDSVQNQTLNVAFSGEVFAYTPAIIRVNAGGNEVADDPIPWEEDTTANPSQYLVANVNTSSGTFGTNTTDAPDAIFGTERWNNGEIYYSFSGPQIANGTYEVRLYFAETCNCAIPGGNPGDRKFHIVIDDVLVAEDFDQYDEAGQTKNGIMRAYTAVVDASNPAIDVKIQKGLVENPAIKGIEIVPISIDAVPGVPSSTVDVGTVFVRESVTSFIQIQNLATVGGDDLEISALAIDNPVFQLVNLPTLPVTLAPQEILTIEVEFSPVLIGTAEGNLLVTYDVNKAAVVIPITGEGGTPGPVLYRVNGGSSTVNANDGGLNWVPTTVSNTSTYSAAFTGSNATGAPNGIFAEERYDSSPASPFLYSFPITDGNYEVRLYFNELYFTAGGNRNFDAFINGNQVLDNFDPFAVALAETGNGRDAIVRAYAVTVVGDTSLTVELRPGTLNNPKIAAIEIISTDPHPPELTVNTNALDFGQVLVGATGVQRTVTLRNEATGADDYIEITPNDISPDFTIISPLNFDRLDPQEELDVVIEFNPQSAQVFSVPFEISHNGTNASPVTITLNGEGVIPAKTLVGGVSQIDFGPREINTTSPAVQVELTNDGTSGGSIQVQSVTINGTNGDQFTHDFDTPFTLGIGETTDINTTLNIIFAPDSVGSKSGVLEITHDGNNSPLQIPLAGEGIESQRPYITGVIPANGATGVSLDISISFDLFLPNLGAGVDPSTLNSTNVILRKASNGQQIAANYGTSGGTDTIVIIPISDLESNTTYTVEITDGVLDQSGAQFLPFNSSFTTGTTSGAPLAGVGFNKFFNIGIPDYSFVSTLEIGPDHRLYAATVLGSVLRWDISGDGTLKNMYQVANFPGKSIIGLEFDPLSTATNMTMWISRNEMFSNTAVYNVQFSGELVKLVGSNIGGPTEAWVSTPYVVGLPRSVKDHLTNSIAWGPNGERAFYVNSGAINSGGDRDNAWGQQPETVLSSSTLRVDINLLEAYVTTNGVPLDVRTGVMVPHPQAGTSLPADAETLLDQNNYGLGDPMLNSMYNPQASGAPVTIYGSGVRNAYDLVWHTNGLLYVPTNGSGAGGNTPATPPLGNLPSSCKSRIDDNLNGDYTGPSVPAALNISKQHDYLFIVEEGGYYGHPNPTRCEWVINGGNPTAGVDPGTPTLGTDYYPIGTQPDRNWRGNAFDFNVNVSANGVIEYMSNTFGGKLQGKLIVTRYNAGRDLIILEPGVDGSIVNSYTNTPGMSGFNSQPLDIVEDPLTGNLYVAELAQDGSLTRVTLLKPDPVLAQQPNIVVSPTELVFNQVAGGPASATQQIRIDNIGQANLQISNLNITGQFQIIGTPPTSVAPGGFININVAFQPTFVGTQIGGLTIVNNDTDQPSVVVTLRGLGTAGEGGNNEPSLQAILNTYGIPVTVGDDNVNTTVINSTNPTAPLLGQELPIQSFEKAGSGLVDIELLAVFGPNPTNGVDPVTTVGWYETGNTATEQSLFSVANGSGQSLNPTTTGNLFFDPADKAFGFYSEWPFFSGRKVYSEDVLNTWDIVNQHHVRVYPLRNSGGIVPNAFIVVTEEHTSGNDFQDVVFIIRNVKSAAAAAGVIETESRMIFSDVSGGAASPIQRLDIANVGIAPINISSITTSAPFQIVSAIPSSIPVGGSVFVDLVFNPTTTGPQERSLTIISNAAQPSVTVELRGLGTAGEGGNNEPSLQWILDTYDIGVSTGDDNPASTTINSNTAIASGLYVGDEVRIQRFEKAGSGPVTIEPIAAYAIDGNPVVNVGWFRSNNPGQLQQVFSVNQGSDQTLNVLTTGNLSFNPGTGVPFGMYAQWIPSPWNGRVTYTEDSLNGFTDAIPHHARIFPLKDAGGTTIANSYIVAYEEWTQGYDYNDIVYIVRNVMPSATVTNGIELENRDWTTLNAQGIPQMEWVNHWMTFSRIKRVNTHLTHNQAVLRIHNTAQTALTINSINITNTNANVDFDGDGNPNDLISATAFVFDGPSSFTIQPGSFYDLTVRFVANFADDASTFNHKGIYYDTLTINSNDLNNPILQVTLGGGYMERPEGNNEYYAPDIVEVLGYLTDLGYPFDSQYIARGDEILSPLWERLNPAQPVYVRQVSAFHGCCTAEDYFRLRNASNNAIVNGVTLTHEGVYGQSLLPTINNGTGPTEALLTPAEPFLVQIAGYSSTTGIQGGQHGVRFWAVRDRNGTLVPGAFYVIQDFVSSGCQPNPDGSVNDNGLCDYNDNTYLITNIQPADSSQYGLTYDTDISVTIDESADPVLVNEDLIYTVTAENLSIYQATDVELVFNVPTNASLVSYTPTVGSCDEDAGVITCSFGNIYGEGSESVEVIVRSSAGGQLNASASVTTTRGDEDTTNNSASISTYVLDPSNPPASLTIIKDATPNTSEVFGFAGSLGTFALNDVDAVESIDVKLNFQTNMTLIAGYDLADDGAEFGAHSWAFGDYGWLKLADDEPINAQVNTRDRGTTPRDQATFNQMQRGDCCTTGVLDELYWEIEIPNGTYSVTVGVGDPSFADSVHAVRAEGQPVVSFVPSAGNFTTSGTTVVDVLDGALTLDAVGGTNTKIAYVHINGQSSGSGQMFDLLLPGTYSITEDLPVQWRLDSVVCDSILTPISINDGAAITLTASENVTCTFNNSLINEPSIRVQVTPATQDTFIGGDAIFNITVTNDGTQTLENVALTSADVPVCDQVIGTLNPLENSSYNCTVTNVNYDFTADFNAVGTINGSVDTVTDSATASVTVVDAGISISKTPDSQSILEGQNAVFTIRVENTGSVILQNVVVSDALVPSCDADLGTMTPGEIENYVCVASSVAATFTNVAVVTGDLPGGNQITAEDSAVVAVSTFTRGTPVYRVNAGGAQVAATDGGPVWRANSAGGAQNFLDASGTLTGNVNVGNVETDAAAPTNGRDSSVPSSAPDQLFKNGRWDAAGGAEMQWNFPVTAGSYEVRLYFANLCTCTDLVGERVFDVSIEGVTVLDDYDIVADVGHQMAVMKAFIINSDTNIDVDFAHVIENPVVSAIEIIPITANASSVLVPSITTVDFGDVTLGSTVADQTVDLTNVISNGGSNITISSITIVNDAANQFSVVSDTTPITLLTSAPDDTTTLTVGFDPSSPGTKSARIEVAHDGDNESPLIIYLNAVVQPPALPQLVFTPVEITIDTLAGGVITSASTEIYATEGTANYTISLAGAPVWLTGVTPASGAAGSTGTTPITIDVNNTGLPPGTYTHRLTAVASGYVSASLDVILQVDPVQYSVDASVSGGNGTIDPVGNFLVDEGDDITFTLTPVSLHKVGQVLVNGVDTPVVGNTLQLTNISEDTTVVVTFIPLPEYTVTASVNGVGGTVTPSTSVTVLEGGSTTVNFFPDTGYTLGEVLVNGVPTAVTNNTLDLTNITEDIAVVATFDPLPEYTITVNPTFNGVVAPNGVFTVYEGDDQTFTVTPNTGYLIDTVTVNGNPVTLSGNTFDLVDINEDKTIIATFVEEPANCHPYSNEGCDTVQVPVTLNAPYCLAWNADEGGILDQNSIGTGFTSVDSPTNNLFPSVPSDPNVNGYEPGNLLVNTTNGTLSITTTKGIMYTINNSQVNALAVGINADVPTIIETTYINPTFPGSNAEQAGLWFGLDEDNYVKLLLGLNAGTPRAQLSTEVLGGSYPMGGGVPNEINVNTGTVSSSVVTLRLILDPINNQVTGQYQVNSNPVQTIGTLPVLSTFFTGQMLPDGESGPVSFAGLYGTHRNGNTPFTATFGDFCISRDPNVTTHDITATADTGGSISPAGTVAVAENDDQTFNIIPDVDYIVLDVEVDSVSVGAVQSYTFENVVADHTIHATFLPVSEAVTVTPSVNGLGGVISPNTPQIVAKGTDITFTLTSAPGYILDSLLVNDVPVTVTGDTYDLVDIQVDTTVVATFREALIFTVTPSVNGVGGTISPSTQQLVTEGDDIAFTFTPDAGNTIDTVLVNGVPVSVTGDTYTITNVVENTTISVSFVVTCSPISPNSCASVPVGVTTPFVLNFDGTEGGILDTNGVGTGFTMVDPPSVNQFPPTPSVPSVPGYEPDNLEVTGGELIISSTRGIQYENAGSTNNNNQVNALGVGFNAHVPVTLETTLVRPVMGSSNGFQQAGLWFGLDEDNYAKIVLRYGGSIEFLTERTTGPGTVQVSSSILGTVSDYANKDVTLYLETNPTTNQITGYYSENGGTTLLGTNTKTIPAAFFTGQPLPNTVAGNYTFGGVFTSSRNATASFDYRFDYFSITPDPAFNNTDPVITDPLTAFSIAEGATATIATGNLEYTDAEQTADELIYTVTGLPANGTLTLSFTDLGLNDTFTQQDIDDGLLAYVHDGTETASDSFDYTITDTFIVPPISGTFNITVNNTNDDPVEDTNVALAVNEGATQSITTAQLLYTDEEQGADELTFTVDVVTTAGTVYLDGVALAATDTFTQQDVIDNLLSYTQDGSETATDSFDFTVTDGAGGSATGTFNINITLTDDLPVAVDDTATADEGATITELDGAVASVLANDSDEEGAVTVVSNTDPTNGTVTVNSDGTFSYTHNGGGSTTDSFTYTIEDSGGQQATATVTITINQIDDLPVAVDDSFTVANAGTATLLDGAVASVLANDSDEEGAVTVVSNTDPTNGTVTVNTDGTFSYTHDGSATTTDSFTYTIEDSGGQQATATVTVAIIPANEVPDAVDDTATADEGGTITVLDGAVTSVLDNDTDLDLDPLQVVSNTDPTNGTVTVNNDGTFSYTHDGSETTTDSFTYTITDGNGGFDTATVTITINPVNDDPTAVDDDATVSEGSSVSILDSGQTSVLANDTDVDNTAGELSVTGNTDGTFGSVTVNSDGTFTYTQDQTVTTPTTDSFTYDISDGAGGTATGTVNITILPPNNAPDAVDDTATADEGGTITLLDGDVASVLANDTDPDTDPIEVFSNTDSANGTVTVNTDGTFSYTHDGSETITDSFTYTIRDGRGGVDTATVTITINAVNDDPTVVDDTLTVDEGTTATELDGAVASVLANDSDVDSSTLTVDSATNGTYGTVTVNPDGTFSYAHDGTEPTGAAATDTFTYTVIDGDGGSATGTVTVTINPVNDAPVANDDNATVTEDVALTIDVIANDTDEEGAVDGATVVIDTDPQHGTAVPNGSGGVLYTPATDYVGPDSFTYTVDDADGVTSNIATVTIDVVVGNVAPVAVNDQATTPEDQPVIISVLVNDTDDQDSFGTITIVTGPTNGTAVVNGNGTVTYTPDPSFSGNDSFVYIVNDTAGLTSNQATVNITVVAVNDAPVLVNNTGLSTAKGGRVTITSAMLMATDADNTTDEITFEIQTAPVNGVILRNGIVLGVAQAFSQADINAGLIAYQHFDTVTFSDSFVFLVSDGASTLAPATFNIQIAGLVSDLPINLDVEGNLTTMPVALDYEWTHMTNVNATNVPAQWYHIVVINASGDIVVDEWVPADQICDGVVCNFQYLDKTPPFVFENGVYTWYVEGWIDPDGDGIGEIVTSDMSQFTVDIPPSQGIVGIAVDPNQGRPTISWDDDPGATWYQVYLGNSQVMYYLEWLPKSDDLCVAGGRCTLTPDINPIAGTYDVWIRSWSPISGFIQNGLEGWEGPVSVTLPDIAPTAVTGTTATATNSGRPTFIWQGVPYVTWYEVWVGQPNGDGSYTTSYRQWHLAASLGCENAEQCRLDAEVDLANGTYEWAVRNWGPGGYNNDDPYTWSVLNSFTVGATTPGIPDPGTPVSIASSSHPVFTWNAVQDASWYQLWFSASDNPGSSATQWYSARQLGCVSVGTVCSISFPNVVWPVGNYQWAIQAYSPGGLGEWSNAASFSVSG